MRKHIPLLSILTTIFLMICVGCIRIGPNEKVTYLIAEPGKPGKIVKKTVTTLQVDEKIPPVEQDITGWVCMPQAHYDALMRALDKSKPVAESKPSESPK